MKPHILSSFGDVALAIGTEFRKYAETALTTLEVAASSPVDKVTTFCPYYVYVYICIYGLKSPL